MIHLTPLWYQDAVTRSSFAYHQLYKPKLGKLRGLYGRKKKIIKKSKKHSENLKENSSLNSVKNLLILNK